MTEQTKVAVPHDTSGEKTRPGARDELDLGSKIRDWVVRYGFVAVTIVLFVYFAATEPAFRTSPAILSMLKFASTTAILGLAMTFAMVVGGMDMSIGSQAGLAVQLAAMTMVFYNMTGGTAIVIVLIAGLIVGAVNAVLIVVCKIPDLLATLAMMFVIQGAKLIPVDGQSVSAGMVMSNGSQAPGKFTQGFLMLDRGTVGPIPMPVVIMLVLTIASWFFLSRTKWGRLMYAVGANPEAARLAGVRVGWMRAAAYIICAELAAIAGLILVSRIGQGDVNAGSSSLLEAVAVALVGTSVLGMNKPNPWGTLLGALLVGIVLTGLTMKGFQYYYQDTSKGLVLVLALLFSYTVSRKKVRYTPAT
ncbi:ABC transporter permease [Propionimicrobium sp. PCR01-08-3]|uniref:ABC transporter permease n=1 Tax=Propionimicrobium sp. PCR01-08-3 TaxID=3052086 RepID=UPI00255C62FE|nr:ABC transporter permease [Propionimicrobium sp. PCR01-08-3]WIY82404.1 ABC transporter permease [Propionimicrobium sp. PCR01-08-3]